MIIYFDTETTGLNPGNICQLSYVMQDKEKVAAKNFFFTVDYVEYGAYLVHGFSKEDLERLSGGKEFPYFSKEIEEDFSNADMVISHNTAFDFMFLNKEFERMGKELFVKNSFCSMKNSVAICKLPKNRGLGYKYPKLNELCAYFHISDCEISDMTKRLFKDTKGYHDARFDTTALYLAINKGLDVNAYEQLKKYL